MNFNVLAGSSTINDTGSGQTFADLITPPNDLSNFNFLQASIFFTTPAILPPPQGLISNLTPSPVPVPAAVWLMGSALLGLVGFRRKATS